MSVAIVIPSLDSPILDRVLAAIVKQRGADRIDEIVVVGLDRKGVLRDGTPRGVRFVDTGEPVSAGRARNIGIEKTRAGTILLLDGDCLPQPGWLLEHLAAQSAGHRFVGGGVLPVGSNHWQLIYNLTLFHSFLSCSQAGPRAFLPTLNLSLDRTVVAQAGPLDEAVRRVEDLDWSARMNRAGIEPYFWPRAAVLHDHSRTTFAQVWRDCAASGYHVRPIRLRHPDVLFAPRLLRRPRLLWLLSPLIAAWATLRLVLREPRTFARFWYALPTIYLTKISWCWGASRPACPT